MFLDVWATCSTARHVPRAATHLHTGYTRVRNRIGTGTTRAPPANPSRDPVAVQRAESLLGASLPDLLRRLYREVSNGGFGPAYGVLGLDDGFRDDKKRAPVDIMESRCDWPGMPDNLLPLCHWGCAIYSFLHCPQRRIFGWHPNPVAPRDDVPFFEQEYTLGAWLAAWLDQPLLAQ